MNDDIKIALSVCVATTVFVAGIIVFAYGEGSDEDSSLISFTSKRELAEFLESSESEGGSYYYRDIGLEESMDNSAAFDGSDVSYSDTNVQVVGVDEADKVKTDGEFIFIASYSKVSVIKAYPSDEMANVTSIDLYDLAGHTSEDSSISIIGLHLFDQRLTILWNLYQAPVHFIYSSSEYDAKYLYSIATSQTTMASVFDVSDIDDPELEFSYGVSGYGITSRMVDGNLYVMSQMNVWLIEGEPLLPHIQVDGVDTEFYIERILFDPETPDASSYINLLSLNVITGEYQYKAVVAGYASTIYMSLDALYLTIPKWTNSIVTLDSEVGFVEESELRTSIYRIDVDDLSMTVAAGGQVKGWLLNQFSMDEHGGYLRVATTTWSGPENAVYVLDSDMQVVGSLEHIAPTETIYSARFIDETLYLVTFRQVDPLFVIDLSDPTAPTIVGELKIPGFSSYLHPVDSGHVLGIGSENGSVKVTLFDVSDPSDPIEQSTFVVEGDYSWSDASYDHKSVLFDLERELLVLPISVYDYDAYYMGSSWYGAYVFTVSLSDGISLDGRIANDDANYYDRIVRSLYIEDNLYTLSDYSIKASSLEDLSEESFLIYSTYPDYYYYYMVDEEE